MSFRTSSATQSLFILVALAGACDSPGSGSDGPFEDTLGSVSSTDAATSPDLVEPETTVELDASPDADTVVPEPDAAAVDTTPSACDGVLRCKVVDGVSCPCGFDAFDPNVLVIAYGPDDMSILDSRIVLVDGTRSPTVCAMGDEQYQAPVLPASAVYFEIDGDISDYDDCESLTGSTAIEYREYADGKIAGSMASTTAGIDAAAYYEGCRLDIEALFPNGTVWVYTLWAPFQYGGSLPDNICNEL